ncbi:MAG: hypothetical protein HLUCCO16_07670 [Phormidium sp. OSCR]|nr:MAG: hypothetical protein HLUCCO16_07670 [Phormidium sp. OSCR]
MILKNSHQLLKKLFVLILALNIFLVGCGPISPQIWTLLAEIGAGLTETVVGQVLEKAINQMFLKLGNGIIVDESNPLKGTYYKPIRANISTNYCKMSYTLKPPIHVTRKSLSSHWKPSREDQNKLEYAKRLCS